MTEEGIQGAFAGHPFLEGMAERHRMLLASGARPFTAAPGDYLVREGDAAQKFYLIQSGHVALETDVAPRGQAVVETVGPGDVVGWSWLVPPHRWQFDARATDAVQGLAFDAAWLREQCERDHELGYRLLHELVAVVARRLAAVRRQRLDIYQ